VKTTRQVWIDGEANTGGTSNGSREFVQPQFALAELEYFGSPHGLKFIVQFHLNKLFELAAQCTKSILTEMFLWRILIKLPACIKLQSPWSPMLAA
jgi:hypothetical protein